MQKMKTYKPFTHPQKHKRSYFKELWKLVDINIHNRKKINMKINIWTSGLGENKMAAR